MNTLETIVLTTQAELRSAKHTAEVHFLCSCCGETKPVNSGKDSCGTGYYYNSKNEPICYPCADKLQVEDLKDRSKPFCAYVGKGNEITTWTGGKLMTIMRAWPCKLTRQSFTHDRNGYLSIHAVDVHGGHWAGRGSEGIAIKLRPVKG